MITTNGERLDRVAPDIIVKLGISHCPEGRMLFPEMSLQKNLELGAYVHGKKGSLVEAARLERQGPKVDLAGRQEIERSTKLIPV